MITRTFEFKDRTPVEESEVEPVMLELGDIRVKCIPVDQCDGLQLLSYFAAMRSTTYTGSDRTAAVIKWLRYVILPEEYAKFEEASKRYTFEIEDVSEIAATLANVYSTRPTTPAGSSTDGQSAGGSSSPDNSGSAESTQQD